MYITLYIISPICNVKELIMDKPHKECGIVGCKLLQAIDSINLYQAATLQLIKGLTFKETVVINWWEN